MDSKMLYYSLDLVSGNGLTMSSEQKSCPADFPGQPEEELATHSTMSYFGARFCAYRIKVNEEKRLPTTVHTIDKEVSVVPCGTFIKSPHGLVQTNRSFEGQSSSEAGKLSCFLHFTEPQNLKKKSILEMADLDPSINFLDPLSEDIPKGLWSLQFERHSTVCVISSMPWLGMTTFKEPMTPQQGYIYMGDGLNNLDLPFML